MKVLRTGAVLIFLSVLLVVAGGAIAGPQGLKVALVFAVLMNGISYFFSWEIYDRSVFGLMIDAAGSVKPGKPAGSRS